MFPWIYDIVSIPASSGRLFKNNYLAEMWSGSEAGSYWRLIDFVYHSTLGLRGMQKKMKKKQGACPEDASEPHKWIYVEPFS